MLGHRQFILDSLTLRSRSSEACSSLKTSGGDLDQEGHGWLLVSGAIFDPTAAQFDVFPNIDESNYEADDYEMFP